MCQSGGAGLTRSHNSLETVLLAVNPPPSKTLAL